MGALRGHAESLMTLTLAWYSPSGTVTVVDRMEVPGFTSEGTTVGKVQGTIRADTTTRMVRVGGTDRPVLEAGVHIPLAGLVPEVGWECVVTGLGAYDDPALSGVCYRVVEVPAKSFGTARRLDVVEVPNVH